MKHDDDDILEELEEDERRETKRQPKENTCPFQYPGGSLAVRGHPVPCTSMGALLRLLRRLWACCVRSPTSWP